MVAATEYAPTWSEWRARRARGIRRRRANDRIWIGVGNAVAGEALGVDIWHPAWEPF